MRNVFAIVVAMLALAPSAYAQGAYVSASLTGDIVRQNRVESVGFNQPSGGEAIGFALRVGSELGARWGVELEFARPQEITNDFAPGVVPLPAATLVPGVVGGVFPPDAVQTYPVFSYRIRTSQRNTMVSSAVWARHEISRRMSLVFLGGVGFHRTTSDTSVTFEPRLPSPFPIALPPSVTNATNYDAGPFAGVEGRIGLTDHAHLVTGVRLHGISGGWLFRPSVGLGWNF